MAESDDCSTSEGVSGAHSPPPEMSPCRYASLAWMKISAVGLITILAVIANGVLVVIAFFISLPAFAIPTSRSWLKFHIGLVVICLVFTLCLGLNEWMQTLSTRANLEEMWGRQSPKMQSMLQQKVRKSIQNIVAYTHFPSLTAVGISTGHTLPMSPILFALAILLHRRKRDV